MPEAMDKLSESKRLLDFKNRNQKRMQNIMKEEASLHGSDDSPSAAKFLSEDDESHEGFSNGCDTD